MPSTAFGISLGEAELVNDETVLLPITLRGVNKPEVFVNAFNNAAEALISGSATDWFMFGLALVQIVKSALKKSK